MCSMQTYFGVDLVVQGQVSEARQCLTYNKGCLLTLSHQVKEDLHYVEILELHQNVLVFRGETLDAVKNVEPDAVVINAGELVD